MANMQQHNTIENHGTGNQLNHHGTGDQIKVESHGTVLTDRSTNITIYGIPLYMTGGIESLEHDPRKPLRDVLIDWLQRQKPGSHLSLGRRHAELIRQRTPGTGQWVLETDSFKAWKDISTSTPSLLIHGPLGAGKTMLSALVIETLREENKHRPQIPCVYFYFDAVNDGLTYADIWAILLEQLLRHEGSSEAAKKLIARYDKPSQYSSSLNPTECFEFFKEQAAIYQAVYLIIDGMDSCPGGKENIFEELVRDLEGVPNNVRLLVTFRSDTIACSLKVSRRLRMSPTRSDLELYARFRITKDFKLDKILINDADRERVVSSVAAVALESEMFILARLLLDNLCKQTTLAYVNSSLLDLPIDLSHAIGSSISKITSIHEESERVLAKHVFTWVMYAGTSLTVDQIRDSFGVSRCLGNNYVEYRPTKESILTACAGLVIQDSKTNTLRLVHESVRSHILENNLVIPEPHIALAETCLSYLLLDELTPGSVETPTLLPYAARYWSRHLGPRYEPVHKVINELINKLFEDSRKLIRTMSVIPEAREFVFSGMAAVHAAVYFNIYTAIKDTPASMLRVNTQCSDGQSALHWAVRLGRFQMLKLLVRRHPDINMQDRLGETPLHKAVQKPAKDAEKIVQFLIESGARSNIRSKSKGLTALESTIRYGPTVIAKILLENRPDVNEELTHGWTALREVFHHGQDIHGKIGQHADGQTTVQNAGKDHESCLIDVLLQHGVDLNSPTKDGWLPLIHTVSKGSLSVIERLLKRYPRPANVNIRNTEDNKSPLRLAITYDRYDVATFLLDYGAEVNEVNEDGWTPLAEAVKKHATDLVWTLLRKGANPNTMGNDNCPALFHAVEKKHHDLIWLLINKGANVNIDGNSLVELALRNEDYSTAWLLCEHGAIPDTRNADRMSTLFQACLSMQIDTVRFLLSRGIHVHYKDVKGFTALHRAVLMDCNEIVTLLVSGGIRQEFLDEPDPIGGDTALILAIKEKRLNIVQTLLRNRASHQAKNWEGWTALHCAAHVGFNDGLRLLLRLRSDPNITGGKGMSAVHCAASSNHSDAETIQVLADNEANLDARDMYGRTPLMHAVDRDNFLIAKKLLSRGADLDAEDDKRWTAHALLKEEQEEMRRIIEKALRRREKQRRKDSR